MPLDLGDVREGRGLSLGALAFNPLRFLFLTPALYSSDISGLVCHRFLAFLFSRDTKTMVPT